MRGERLRGELLGSKLSITSFRFARRSPNLETTDDPIIIGLKDPKDLASPEELKAMDTETEGVKYLILPLWDTLVG